MDETNININNKNILKEKLQQLLNNRLNSLKTKFEEDISNLENYKYEYYDCYKSLNSSLVSTDYEEEGIIDSKLDKSEILNTTNYEGNDNFKDKIRNKTPLRTHGKSVVMNNNANANNISRANQSRFSQLDRSKTPIRADYSNNTSKASLLTANAIPNNVTKRMEARRESQRKRDSTPNNIGGFNNTIKDKSPIPNIRSKNLNKSPYPHAKQSILDRSGLNISNKKSSNNVTRTENSHTTNFTGTNKDIYHKKQAEDNNHNSHISNNTKPSILTNKKIDAKAARMDAGIQRNKKNLTVKRTNDKDNSTLSGMNKSMIEDRKKSMNKTSISIKQDRKHSIIKDKKDLNWSFTNPSEIIKPERSKTPIVQRRKIAKVTKIREIQHKGHECISLLVKYK